MTERELLDAARRGDEDAFRHLVEPHHRALRAHCYRMLRSLHDTEDALQDALLRAWRGLSGFDGRSGFGGWLHRIATRACLDMLRRRPMRVLPIEYARADPAPSEGLGVVHAAPEARYERREAAELAFVAALRQLSARQRAVLILRDVLGFSAEEVSRSLGTTVAAVNSALQRAHRTVEERLPQHDHQARIRRPGDQAVREVVERFVDAIELGDVPAIVALLAEDAALAMRSERAA